ncbi:hypothetical protein GQ600_7106 [Phytophthora cactorum]|nr:hypothetical protein GQ600_7106 [Phytophthora cactorum]
MLGRIMTPLKQGGSSPSHTFSTCCSTTQVRCYNIRSSDSRVGNGLNGECLSTALASASIHSLITKFALPRIVKFAPRSCMVKKIMARVMLTFFTLLGS